MDLLASDYQLARVFPIELIELLDLSFEFNLLRLEQVQHVLRKLNVLVLHYLGYVSYHLEDLCIAQVRRAVAFRLVRDNVFRQVDNIYLVRILVELGGTSRLSPSALIKFRIRELLVEGLQQGHFRFIFVGRHGLHSSHRLRLPSEYALEEAWLRLCLG